MTRWTGPAPLAGTAASWQAQLPELHLATAELPPALQDFCRYYGLDFAGQREGVSHRLGTVTSGNYRLATHVYRQPGAHQTLLLVHGYFDHSGLYRHLIEYGLSRGCDVIIFDLPGHGLSTGETVSIDDFREYGQAVADVVSACELRGRQPLVMAQSTGCAALIEYARHWDWPFRKAVLLAPLVRPASWNKVKLLHSVLHRFRAQVGRRFVENSEDAAFLAFLASDPLQSRVIPVRWVGALRRWLESLPSEPLGIEAVLVIQGDQDSTVDWRYNLEHIAQLFPGRQQAIIRGARHQLANESSALRETYLRLVDGHLGLSPTAPGE